jgi:hypothetical protein
MEQIPLPDQGLTPEELKALWFNEARSDGERPRPALHQVHVGVPSGPGKPWTYTAVYYKDGRLFRVGVRVHDVMTWDISLAKGGR